MFSFFNRKPPRSVARRLVTLAVAHGLREQEIPRLLPAIGYAHLADPQLLARAVTPAVVDAAAELFGVRREFLEGLDGLVYVPFGSGRVPARESAQVLVDAVAQAVSAWPAYEAIFRGPLALLTTLPALDRHSPHQQWLVPIIIEPSGAELDGPVYRCRVFGGYFDWNVSDQRIGLKALTWLIWNRLRKVVPLYQVARSELVDVLSGELIPSVVFQRPIVTNPSLEDYVGAPGTSAPVRESDELPAVLSFLQSSGLQVYWEAAFARVAQKAHAATEPASPAPSPQATTEPAKPRGGKREASHAAKNELRATAGGIWEAEPRATIAAVVERLKRMPHLRGAAMGDSAIRKAIASVAPPGASKPGRKPKQST